MLNYQAVSDQEITFDELIADITLSDLRDLTEEMVEIMLDLIIDCVDADVIFEPVDPEAHGIPLGLSQESYGATTGLTVAPLGEVHLLVPASRLGEARDLLQEYYAEDQD